MESWETSLKSPPSFAGIFDALRAVINGVPGTPSKSFLGMKGGA
jgi:hypothetical protein